MRHAVDMAPLESPRSAKCSLPRLFSLPAHRFQNCFLSSRRYVHFKNNSTHPRFFVVGRPRSHSQRPPQGRTIAAPVSFMISARPPGKATVRTTDIQVFGVCFSPILGDGLATSGESLKRYMACADSPFPGRSLGDRCRRPPGHRPGQPSRKYSRDVRAPVPWGGLKTDRATKKKSGQILQRIVN